MKEEGDTAPPPKRPRTSSDPVNNDETNDNDNRLSEKTEESTASPPQPISKKAKVVGNEGDEDSDDDLFGEGEETPAKAIDVSSTDKSSKDQPSLESLNQESKDPLPSKSQRQDSPHPSVLVPAGLPPISGNLLPLASATSPVPVSVADVSIPRKKSPSKSIPSTDSPSPSGPSSFSNAKSFTPGTKYGLPEGVMVPQTIVQNRLFEAEMNSAGSKLMEILKSLPVNLINDALVEYDDAVDIKGASAIRNHGAYLFGVVKRYVSVHERAMKGEGTGILPMGVGLTPVIEQRLESLVSSGFCTEQEMNEKVKSKIRMLSEKDAVFALDELSSVDRTSIRNFGSYFMGILNRYMRGDVTSKVRPRPPHSSSSSSNQFGNGNNNNNNRYGHPPQRRSNDGNRPWQPQNSPMPPGGPPHHQTSYPSGPMHHQQGFSGGHNNMAQPPHQQQHYMPPQQHPPQFNPHAPQPYPPQNPPPGFNHPHPMHSNMSGRPAMQTQGFQQTQSNTYQHNLNPVMGADQRYGNQQQFPQQQPYPPQQNANMMHQRMPHQLNQDLTLGQTQPTYGQQQTSWQTPEQAAAPVDIFGLADKAASAIQALGASKNMGEAFGQSYPQAPQPGYGPQGQPYQQQQQPPGGYGQMQAYGGAGVYNQQHNMQPQGMQQAKRRTTATIADLPSSVQYAVQNLVANRALDMLPDEGIMGMIHDLPEELALASLQKFETLDKSQMRNKTAYLAGVLRRELEKINRR